MRVQCACKNWWPLLSPASCLIAPPPVCTSCLILTGLGLGLELELELEPEPELELEPGLESGNWKRGIQS